MNGNRLRKNAMTRGMCLPLAAALFLAGAACSFAATADGPDFNSEIRPILSENCFACHGPDARARRADMRLDVREEAIRSRDGITPIVPGQASESELVRRVFADDPDERMPPPESKLQLTEEEKRTLRAWIDGGAPYALHWAFRPIRKPEVPKVKHEDRVRNPIDAFVLRRLEQEGFSLSPDASREKLIRRVAFDLTGLPPTLGEIDAFLGDRAPQAFGRVVDEYLSRETYGERMASEWLDVARYSDTYGYQVDRDRRVWPWRDWVVRAFNRNLPYDDFVTRQLAGDLMPGAGDDEILATTFNRLHPQKVEGGSVPEEFRIEYVADRAQTFATAFLGLTFECARCHDHKYDPLTQAEYYQLTAFFDNIDEAGLYSFFTPSVPTPTLLLADENQKRKQAEMGRAIESKERQLARIAETEAAAFEKWLEGMTGAEKLKTAPWDGLVGDFGFESIEGGQLENAVDGKVPGTTPEANRLVEGRAGKGLELTGDDEVNFKIGDFTRNDPFSVALWMKTPAAFDRAVIFHRSRAWTDAASRGYQLLIEDGRLSASLIHFWPGNAIRVRAKEPVKVDRWMHVAVTYDGSSRAKGLRIYVDGEAAEAEVVRDNLFKNITGGGGEHIAIGARFRDRGFKGGVVDEFKVFNRELTALEAARLAGGQSWAKLAAKPPGEWSKAGQAKLKEYYLATVSTKWSEGLAALKQARAERSKLVDAIPEIMVMRELPEPRPTHFLNRGAYDSKRQEVRPVTPEALHDWPVELPRNRLGLARWLTHPDNPLTARVTVNRYWQMFFGSGLVKTSNDFGSQGSPPTHPELLDWLARDFMDHGWDLKRLIRQMVTSSVYRQSSVAAPELAARDPRNLWLGRAPRYRLPAEMIRDNALYLSGLLAPRVGGPPVKPYEVSMSFKPSKPDEGEGLYRRSLYTYWKRTAPAPVMMALDASKRDVCSVSRESTATPLQAFVFMNDPQFVEASRKLAERVLRECGGQGEAACERLFRLLTSRRATGAEAGVLRRMYGEQLEAFENQPGQVRALLNIGKAEVQMQAGPSRLAAVTVVATALLSHDECVVKR